MSDWLSSLSDALAVEPALVRVVLGRVLGSAPREAGASMLVGRHALYGSIGGGNLEFKAIELARAMLREGAFWHTASFPLGPALGQCCGGFVELWFERVDARERHTFNAFDTARSEPVSACFLATIATPGQPLRRTLVTQCAADSLVDFVLDAWVQEQVAAMRQEQPCAGARLIRNAGSTLLLERLESAPTLTYLFGAGHVGRALVRLLTDLPFKARWVDGRNGVFPDLLPPNVTTHASPNPTQFVQQAPSNACFLVMTHSHALDYEICREVLRLDRFCFLGLIGSHTKAVRFAHRLARDGIAAQRVGRLVCPIGISGIQSKQPEAIAVAVAAQLLRLRELGWDEHAAHERGGPAQTRAVASSKSSGVTPITVHRARRES